MKPPVRNFMLTISPLTKCQFCKKEGRIYRYSLKDKQTEFVDHCYHCADEADKILRMKFDQYVLDLELT